MRAVVLSGITKLECRIGNFEYLQYLENLILHLIGSGTLDVVLQFFSVLHSNSLHVIIFSCIHLEVVEKNSTTMFSVYPS